MTELSGINKEFFREYMELFLKENSKTNLISRNDEGILFEKHIIDSLGIGEFFGKYFTGKPYPKTLLDIGTGGGFPAVPIAIVYPQIQVTALDSIRKKVNAVESIKVGLGLQNLTVVCNRAENLREKFDVITSRAVAKLDRLCEYALPLLNDGGYFVAYKSQSVQDEIAQASRVLRKHNARVLDVISYELLLADKFVRNLVIIKVP